MYASFERHLCTYIAEEKPAEETFSTSIYVPPSLSPFPLPPLLSPPLSIYLDLFLPRYADEQTAIATTSRIQRQRLYSIVGIPIQAAARPAARAAA